LAVNANIPNSNGVIWGQVFAKSFTSNGGCAQINWIPFTGGAMTSPVPDCGDGIVQVPEQCDLGSQINGAADSCCSSTCQLLPSTHVCRPDAGTCDIPESCTGTTPTCPTDQFLPITTPCGGLFGICDVQLEKHCPGNGPICLGAPPAPLWFWDAYNVLSFNTFNCTGGDVEGRLAVRNSCYLDGFTLGLEITPTDYYSAFALLVAGDCTWLSGSVHGGSIGVGGTFTAPSYLTTSAISPVDVTGSQFDSAQSYYESIQSLLSGLGTNAQASVIYGDGLMITCDDHTNILNHVAVDGGILSTTNFYLLKNCLFTAGWVIDVTGTGPVTIQGSPFPGVVERVVYNILGSGRIITGNTGVGGNILAPQNSYVQYTGVTYGRVIVGDVIFARQNNKPNCINFQTVNITNLCLKAVNVGD